MVSGRKEKRYGFTDRPEVSDALGMNSRCRGIARFVESCETPVTMAVQGDWGTGKTTAMQIIKSNLSEKNQKCTIWFNTWEFSSYSRTESIMTGLVELMILRLREYLGKPDEKLSRDAACVAKKVLGVAGECFTPAKVLDSVIEKFGSDDKRTDSIREIIHQKNTLDQLVNELKLKEDDRFFVFIDDLDRLEPQTAIDVLEGLKNLAEYEKFVYIYAIDQSVVERGLKSKFGDEFDKEKARKYFDKIIQVPFSLPVTSYDIPKYISGFLDDDSPETVKGYADILSSFGIRNPRTIKRSFNLLQLYSFIDNAEKEENAALNYSADDEKSKLKSYALMLLRMEFPDVYEDITSIVIANRNDMPEMYRQIINYSKENVLKCLDAICKLFFDLYYSENWHDRYSEGIKSFSAMMLQRRDMNDEKDEWRSRIPAAEMLIDMYKAVRRNPAVEFGEGWEVFGFSSDKLAVYRNSIKVEALCNDIKIRVTWYSTSQYPNLTVYTSVHTDKTLFRNAEKGFNCIDNNQNRSDRQFNYYYNDSSDEHRVTLILNPDTHIRKYFNIFLSNLGLISEIQ